MKTLKAQMGWWNEIPSRRTWVTRSSHEQMEKRIVVHLKDGSTVVPKMEHVYFGDANSSKGQLFTTGQTIAEALIMAGAQNKDVDYFVVSHEETMGGAPVMGSTVMYVVDLDMEKLRRRVRDALNKTADVEAVMICANALRVGK